MTSKSETVTLDDLVSRCRRAAEKMGKKNPNRALLFNVALAFEALGQQLEQAWKTIQDQKLDLEAENDRRRIIVLPGGRVLSVN